MNAFATSKFPAKPGAAKEQQAIAEVQIAETQIAEAQIAEAQIAEAPIAEVQVAEAQVVEMGADKVVAMKLRAEVQVEKALEMEGKFKGTVPRKFLPYVIFTLQHTLWVIFPL
jgi:hypothetical protein